MKQAAVPVNSTFCLSIPATGLHGETKASVSDAAPEYVRRASKGKKKKRKKKEKRKAQWFLAEASVILFLSENDSLILFPDSAIFSERTSKLQLIWGINC